MKKAPLLLFSILFFTARSNAQAQQLLNYVNPFIGTDNSNSLTRWGSEGGTYPGAVAPNGFLQLSPETRANGTSGYNYKDSSIFYLSCLRHNSGFPSGSAGRLFIMPLGDSSLLSPVISPQSFSHKNETATPGYYAVRLNNGIHIEASAATRSAIFRFTFPAGITPSIFIGDAGAVQQTTDGFSTDRYNAVFKADRKIIQLKKTGSNNIIVFESNSSTPTTVLLQFGVSSIDQEHARKNMAEQIGSSGFDALRQKTANAWLKVLSVATIEDSSENNKTVFYTALYHSRLLPWIVSDVDGRYKGADGKIHTTKGKQEYGGFSPWDTYRSLHPLLTLLYPSLQQDMVLSMLNQYEQQKFLPVESMTGNHSIPIIVDSYLKGIPGIDKDLAFRAMKKSIVDPPFIQSDMLDYQSRGYIPLTRQESVTRTLEYAYDDWALGNFTRALQLDKSLENRLLNRSYNYRNLFHAADRLFLPRGDSGFNTSPGTIGYKEGDPWVYAFSVPHNSKDLINLMGGETAFTKLLDSVLQHEVLLFDNETVFQVPYLFNEANQPAKTQFWVHKILTDRFNNAPGGIPGNDDLGSMSSWYVFSALGFYPSCVGRPYYSIGSPLFRKVKLKLENGANLTVNSSKVNNNSPYVRSLRFNGKAYTSSVISHQALINNGELSFDLDQRPISVLRTNHQLSETKTAVAISSTQFNSSSTAPAPHELFYLRFTLKNKGAAGSKRVQLFVNGHPIAGKYCFVAANTTRMDSIPCRLYPYGSAVLSIDGLTAQRITVRKNNISDGPKLLVEKLTLRPTIPVQQTQHLSYSIKNIGGENQHFSVPVRLDDSVISTRKLSLAAGESITVHDSIQSLSKGFHVLSIEGASSKFKVYNERRDALLLHLRTKKSDSNIPVPDLSEFNNQGQIVGRNAAYDPDGNLIFGDSSFVRVPGNPSLDLLGEDITMMAWIYASEKDNGNVDIFTKGDNHVFQTSGNKSLGFFAGGWGRGDCTVQLPTNWVKQWHHIAGVCAGNQLMLYIDGKLAGSSTLSSTENLSVANEWNLGRNEEFPGERIFHGHIDRVKVFAAALNAEEVLAEMNQ